MVSFKVLSQTKYMTEGDIVLFWNWYVRLRGDTNFKPHPQNRIWAPLGGSFQNFRRAFLSSWEYSPSPPAPPVA